MKKFLVGAAASAAIFGALAVTVFAAQPASPGCFGRDRAAGVAAITGKVWGDIASDRAGTNGELNQAYKDSCGGSPTE